jgi:hypothetical protein
MDWVTFWANFSQTHLVTLPKCQMRDAVSIKKLIVGSNFFRPVKKLGLGPGRPDEFEKKSPNPFLSKLIHLENTLEKSGTTMWATSVIFKRLPKVNNRPLGEFRPNFPHSGHPVLVS